MSSKDPSILERFPHEILTLIHEKLDDVSAVCLKYTNSTLRSKVGRDSTAFSRCSKWLIMCRFEQDEITRLWPHGELGPGFHILKNQFTCGFCKVKRTRAQIEGRRSGRCGINFPVCDPWRVLRPPEVRYCARHPLFIIWVKPSPNKPEPARWVTTRRLTCMHCTAHVGVADTRSAGCENCKCDVCPRARKIWFIRYGPLPKAARGGRPYIDGLLSYDCDPEFPKFCISEVGSKFGFFSSPR